MKTSQIKSAKELIKLKESVNKAFDKKIETAQLSESINKLDKLSFGSLRNIFENISDKLYETKNGKRLIKRYVNVIKESNNLRKLYTIQDSIKNPVGATDANLFLEQALKVNSGINKTAVRNRKKILSNIIKECVVQSYLTNADLNEIINEYDTNAINEAIDYVLTNESTVSNIAEYSNKLSVLKEHINENINNAENINEVKNNGKISDLNKIFNECKTDWEKAMLKDISKYTINGKGMQGLFEEYKASCINVIDESLENEDLSVSDKSELEGIKEKLSLKEFKEETVNEDLYKLCELKNTLTNE